MKELKIRKAQKRDLRTIQNIAKNTIDRCYRSFLGDEGVDWFIYSGESNKELETNLDNCDVLLINNSIVAFTIYFKNLIHLMMVDVNFHRIGIGSKLLAHSENQLLRQGKSIIRLETFEGNHQAINFYKKNGWCIINKKKDEKYGFVRVYFEKSLI